eukprot:scaffold175249_cov51-Attheya_sp.AAC.1
MIQTSVALVADGAIRRTATTANKKVKAKMSKPPINAQSAQLSASTDGAKPVAQSHQPTQWQSSSTPRACHNTSQTPKSTLISKKWPRLSTRSPIRSNSPDGHVIPSESVPASLFSTNTKMR